MLKIKHKHSLKQKYFIDHPDADGGSRMQLSESKLNTTDDIARAITTDDEVHDNKWELNERPDGEALAAFWAKVRDEARQDPHWNFADESEA
ncbi:MAG TPA: hypothetical protein VFZ58_02475 [Candidatus Saccharimonadales bacterium]